MQIEGGLSKRTLLIRFNKFNYKQLEGSTNPVRNTHLEFWLDSKSHLPVESNISYTACHIERSRWSQDILMFIGCVRTLSNILFWTFRIHRMVKHLAFWQKWIASISSTRHVHSRCARDTSVGIQILDFYVFVWKTFSLGSAVAAHPMSTG